MTDGHTDIFDSRVAFATENNSNENGYCQNHTIKHKSIYFKNLKPSDETF